MNTIRCDKEQFGKRMSHYNILLEALDSNESLRSEKQKSNGSARYAGRKR